MGSGVIGGVLLVPALLVLLTWPVVARSRTLTINAVGVHYRDPRGAGFVVGWDALRMIGLSRTTDRSSATGVLWLRTTLVRLVLAPAGDGFATRHPPPWKSCAAATSTTYRWATRQSSCANSTPRYRPSRALDTPEYATKARWSLT